MLTVDEQTSVLRLHKNNFSTMMTEPGVYTSISVSDEQAEAAQAIAVDYTSKHQYSNQAYDLTWSDSFYDNNEDEEEAVVDDVIAVFDVDYTQMRKTLRRQQWHYLFAMISSVIMFGDALFHKDNLLGGGFIFKILWLYGGVSYVGVTVFMAYMVRKAQRELVESEFGMHVAVTREGIRKDLGSSISHTTTVVSFKLSMFSISNVLLLPTARLILMSFTTDRCCRSMISKLSLSRVLGWVFRVAFHAQLVL